MGRKNLFFYPKTSFLKAGMTLVEVLVVVASLGLLVLVTALTIRPSYQMARAYDSRRKADLKKISTAVEDYAGDHPCYPVNVYEDADTCRPATGFAAYLDPVPCDPRTKKPYVYRRLDTPGCKKYAIFATLELGETVTYGQDTGNYVVSNVRLEPTAITPTPPGGGEEGAPTVTPTGQYYGCFAGVCQPLPGPVCVPNYIGSKNCLEMCGTPQNPQHQCEY
jgi:type II secretory pathway pseudopilin PulG